MKKCKSEKLFGVPPQELENGLSAISISRDTFTVYKSAKKGQTSFRITKELLSTLFETYKKIGKKPLLIITIPDSSNEYTLTCTITKESK